MIGGGITGAGIALDASSRGLRTGLVERADFASGTSSKSSKLVHGGLRYLEQREFGLMREASTERDLLRRLAPHLVEPIPFVLPVSDRWKRAQFGVGLWAYDALATFRNLKVHRHLDADETEVLVPPFPKDKIKGGYLFYDCKTDDVRLVMEVLVQARRHGAAAVNYTKVTAIDAGAELSRVQVLDVVDGNSLYIRAKRVISATGVWADRVEQLADPGAAARVRPSKGIHIVLRRDVLPMGDAAAFIPDVDRKRMLFVIPWIDSVLVGTTDNQYEGDIDTPSVEPGDRKYCLDSLNAIFGTHLGDDDICGAYAGLRPLIAGKADDATADLSRRHTVYDIAPGVVGITGGKLTTYRRMARDAVDRVAEELGATPRSSTRSIKLGSSDVRSLKLAVQRRCAALSIEPIVADNLVRCYGERAMDVVDIARAEGSTDPVSPGHLPLNAEAAYCARYEMAVKLNDFLARRSRLALTDPAGGIGRGSTAADLMGRELGWSKGTRSSEIKDHRNAVEHERGIPLKEGAEASLIIVTR